MCSWDSGVPVIAVNHSEVEKKEPEGTGEPGCSSLFLLSGTTDSALECVHKTPRGTYCIDTMGNLLIMRLYGN